MTIKLARRIAGAVLRRGVSSIRIKPEGLEDAKKAITREDVRGLVQSGTLFAVPMKHNLSIRSDILREKRNRGRGRGKGKRKGTAKARRSVDYPKRIRGQRRVLRALRDEKKLEGKAFRALYRLVKGGGFDNKASLLSHIRSKGTEISDEEFERLRHV